MITNSRLAVAVAAVALSVVVLPPAPAQADTGGKRLVYLDHGWAYRATAAEPTHRHRLVRPRHSIVEEVAVSPDGSRVAELLQIDHPGGSLEHRLVVAGAGGKHRHKVWSNDDPDVSLTGFAWSPNSKRLYYGKLRNEPCGLPYPSRLMMARIHAGTVERSPVPGGDGLTSPTVSPGGGRLAAVRTTYDDHCFATSSSLVKVRLRDGHVSAPLLTVTDTQFALTAPAWSPDDARIAVVLPDPCCARDGQSSDIGVVAADGRSNGIPMVVASGNSEFMLNHPAWKSVRQLWYARSFETVEDRTPSRPGNLYSVHLSSTGDTFSTPVQRTKTPKRDEGSPSFGLHP